MTGRLVKSGRLSIDSVLVLAEVDRYLIIIFFALIKHKSLHRLVVVGIPLNATSGVSSDQVGPDLSWLGLDSHIAALGDQARLILGLNNNKKRQIVSQIAFQKTSRVVIFGFACMRQLLIVSWRAKECNRNHTYEEAGGTVYHPVAVRSHTLISIKGVANEPTLPIKQACRFCS